MTDDFMTSQDCRSCHSSSLLCVLCYNSSLSYASPDVQAFLLYPKLPTQATSMASQVDRAACIAFSALTAATLGPVPGSVCSSASWRRSGSPVEKPCTYSSGVWRPSGSRNTCTRQHERAQALCMERRRSPVCPHTEPSQLDLVAPSESGYLEAACMIICCAYSGTMPSQL